MEMNAAMRVAIAGIGAFAAVGGLAQPAEQAAILGNLQVKEVNVAEIDTAHVKLAVDLNLTVTQSATLENLRLCSLHLNGLPVFAAPLNQELVFKKGVATALPPLYVTILFRDLRTTEPLRRMIQDQSVKVEGEMVAEVRLNLLEKLALHTQHPSVVIALNQEVPAATGVTALQRGMALSILGMIDSGLQATSVVGGFLPDRRPAWIGTLEASAQANLFVVESSYSLAEAETSYPVISQQLGFRIKAAQVVTTAEAQTPWKYDTEFLGAVQSGAAKLAKNSQEIQLRPLGLGDPLRHSAKDFSVEMRGASGQDSVISTGSDHSKLKLMRRTAPTSLAVLTLQAPPVAPPLAAASANVVAQDSWAQVAVFRLRVDATTKQPSFEVLQMSASRDGQGIHLSEPVDAAVFGSPIATPDGVIGLVQDEQTGAFLPDDLLTQAVPAAAVVQ